MIFPNDEYHQTAKAPKKKHRVSDKDPVSFSTWLLRKVLEKCECGAVKRVSTGSSEAERLAVNQQVEISKFSRYS